MKRLMSGAVGLVILALSGSAHAAIWEQYGAPATVTAAASAHTKGSWTALTGVPIGVDATGGLLWVRGGSNAVKYLVDLGYSLPPFATVITAGMPQNILVQTGASADIAYSAYLPLRIPRGAILYARTQSDTASTSVYVSYSVVQHENGEVFDSLIALDTIGENTATTSGAVLDPGGVADTESAWVQLVAPDAMPDPVRWLSCFFGGQTSLSSDSRYKVDVGLGPVSGEQVEIPDIMLRSDNESDALIPSAVSLPQFIERGTPISARVSSNNTTATTREIETVCVLFGE